MKTTILITMGATLLASTAFVKLLIDDFNQMLYALSLMGQYTGVESYPYDAVTFLAIPGAILLVIGLIALAYKIGKKS